MKVFYIAWNGTPCSKDGRALTSGNGFKCSGRALLTDIEVYLTYEEAIEGLQVVRENWSLTGFSVEEFEA